MLGPDLSDFSPMFGLSGSCMKYCAMNVQCVLDYVHQRNEFRLPIHSTSKFNWSQKKYKQGKISPQKMSLPHVELVAIRRGHQSTVGCA